MRVTNKMLSNSFLNDMKVNLTNMKKIQQQMTSGKEIRKPSDDPFKVARSMQLHTDINTNKQYKENIVDTANWLDTTDTALNQAGNVLQRIRELLVASGNAGYSPNERKAIKDEVNAKMGEMAQILNTNFDGKYVFGGTRGTTKPVEVLNPYVSTISDVETKSLVDGKSVARGSIKGDYYGTEGQQYRVTTSQIKDKDDQIKVKIEIYDSESNDSIEVSEKDVSVKNKNEPLDVYIGDGMTLHLDASDANQIGEATYEFNTEVIKPSENTKLKYNIKDENNYTNEINMISSKLVVEISQGVTMEYSVSASDVIEFKNEKGEDKNLIEIFSNIVNHLDGNNDEGTAIDDDAINKLIKDDLQDITDTINNLLRVRSEVGAKQNRMDGVKEKNVDETFNMTEILSENEDIDITEKSMEYAVMITVYMASLQTSARVLQPTLMDYLR